jgi:cytochrome c
MAQDRITNSVLTAALILSVSCSQPNEITTSPPASDSTTTASSTLTTITNTSTTTTAAEAVDPRVLVFSETAGFRHDSIPAGIAAITSLGDEQNFDVTQSEDSSVFAGTELTNYDVVVFLSTTGDILGAP